MNLTALLGKLASGNWFNKHGLLTSFFPNLMLWGATLLLISPAAAREWIGVKDATPTVAALLFLAWVIAASFATVNLQPALLRLYRGDWAHGGILGTLAERRREYWRQQLRKFQRADNELQQVVTPLASSVQLSEDVLARYGNTVGAPPIDDANMAVINDKIDHASTLTNDALKADTAIESVADALKQAAVLLWECRTLLSSAGTPSSEMAAHITKADARISALCNSIVRKAKPLAEEWDARREQLLRATTGRLPSDPLAVEPTRLGNVYRTAEEDLRVRYGLRPWLLASHLRTVLPTTEAVSVLDGARIAIDQAVTLSAMTFVFGLITACALMNGPVTLFGHAFTADGHSIKWILPAVLVTALSTKLISGSRTRAIFAAVVVSLLIAWSQIASDGTIGKLVSNFVILLVALGVAAMLSWVAYSNAVEAALSYCADLKMLFDIHRHKILEALRLRVPSDLAGERAVWTQIGEWLARGYTPDRRYFVYAQLPADQLPPVFGSGNRMTRVWAAARSLPPFSITSPASVTALDVSWSEADQLIPISEPLSADKHCLLTAVAAGEPLKRSQLVHSDVLRNHEIVSLGVRTDALPDSLEIGQRVNVMFLPTGAEPVEFENILVVDMSVSSPNSLAAEPARSTLSLAIPQAVRKQFVRHVALAHAVFVTVELPLVIEAEVREQPA